MTLNVTFIQIIDLVGTFAFAISGVRLAARKEFDLFGAFVVGFVTAVGGGTLRDLLLDVPPFWIQTKSYVLVTLLALLVTITFKKWIVKFNYTFFIFDAIGLGLFTVVGLEKSLAAGGIFRKDIYALAVHFNVCLPSLSPEPEPNSKSKE